MLSPNQTILHYRILEKLGEGGMGVVYKAEDTKLKRTVALKFLPGGLPTHADEQARFLQEAQAASALNHPNVCLIYRIDEADGQPFIEMEFVDGITLRRRLDQGPLPVPEAVFFAIQTGEALAEAHAKGIVHRDVKPENIMVTARNQIKVMDFGLAKLKGSVKLTRTSSTLGTLAYMSPEQVQGADVDQRSDIFSFGIILYEMLAGRSPFRGDHEAATIYSIVNEEPPPLVQYRDGVPADLVRIVGRSLQKNVEERYQHIDDLVSELKFFQKQEERRSGVHSRSAAPPGGAEELPRSAGVERGATAGERSAAPVARPAPATRRRLLAGALAGLLVLLALAGYLLLRPREEIRSIAVMPFENAGGETEYLADGFTESLINVLSRLPSVKVMSRSSVFRFKGRDLDPQEAGRKLGVGAVLLGRLGQRGSDLAVSVELVDASDNSHIWGEQYQKNLADIQALESEISREVSRQLKVALTGEQRSRLGEQQTENTGAYQLYLKGRYYWNKRTPEAFQKAEQLYGEAVRMDPSFALAYAGLSEVYGLLGSYYIITPKESFEKSQAAATRALALDEGLPQAHTMLAAMADTYLYDFEAAEVEYKRALALDPNYATAHQWYGEMLCALGRNDESIEHCRRAIELDPLSPILYSSLSMPLVSLKRYDDAIAEVKKGLDIEPNFPRALQSLALCYFFKGEREEGLRMIRQAVSVSDSGNDYLSQLICFLGLTGRKDEARRVLSVLVARSKRGFVSAFLMGQAYVGLGDLDKAFRWFDRAVAERDVDMEQVNAHPLFDLVRHDPRFPPLVKKVGLPVR